MAEAAPARGFHARLLCETLRHWEQAGQVTDDEAASLRALAAGGDFEQRLLARAGELAPALGLDAALERLRRRARLLLGLLLGLAFIAGIAAARGVLGTPAAGPVNFFLALAVMLGLHALALLPWLLSLALGARLGPPGALAWLWSALLRSPAVAGGGAAGRAALGAWLETHARAGVGRWLLGSLLHAGWVAALSGMLAATLLLLSARQYDFVWETTILPESAFLSLTETLAAAPEALGWRVPDPALTEASRRGGPPPADADAARAAWSGLLLGALVVYGLLPRALLLALCALLLARARRGLRLDESLPAYARLRPRLSPAAARRGVVDAAPPAAAPPAPREVDPGPPAPVPGTRLLGLDIDPPATGWPPPLTAAGLVDLGLVQERAQFEQALKTLERSRGPVLVVASLAASPDRGVLRNLSALAARAPLSLLLTQGGRARQRLGESDFARRLADWRTLAASAGLATGHLHVLDLDDAREVRAHLASRQTLDAS